VKREYAVYVAGPLFSSGDALSNTRRAIDLAVKVELHSDSRRVFHPFVPHAGTIARQLVCPMTHIEAQEWDDFWLRKCDMLVYLPGHSLGTEHEIELAESLGIPVFRCDGNGLGAWLHRVAEVLERGQELGEYYASAPLPPAEPDWVTIEEAPEPAQLELPFGDGPQFELRNFR
jgi:hypothetical protein